MGTSGSVSRRATNLFFLCMLSVLHATSAGCESRISLLGAACTLSSDCAADLVCLGGRCRSECTEARDCMFPLECMVLASGAGGCRVEEDGVCPRGSVDCGPGLECIGGRCAQPCEDHSECAAAQTCGASTGCDRVPAEGPCDLLSGGGCGEGQTCTPAGCSSLGVTAAMAGGLHEPCTDDTCAPGLTCADGRCLRWCEFERDGTGAYTDRPRTSCGTGSRCAGAGYSGGPPPPEGRGYCTQPCDPSERGEAAGCPSEMTCGLLFFNDASVASGCYPPLARVSCTSDPMADGCRNRPCWMGYGCEQGVDCSPELTVGSMGGRRCLGRCLDDEDCGAEERCYLDAPARVFDDERAPIVVGTCLPTCGIDAAMVSTTRGCPSGVADGSVTCDVHNGASAGVDWAYCMPSCRSDSDCFAALTCDEVHAICTPRGGYSP